MFIFLSDPAGGAILVLFPRNTLLAARVLVPMSGKMQKLPTKRGRASEDLNPNYDVTRFVNESAADGSALSARIDRSSRKRVFITLTTFSAKRLRLRDGELFANHLIHLR